MSHLTPDGRARRAELRVGRGRHWPSPSRSSAAWCAGARDTLGNFWVDLTRTTLRVLLPLAFVFARRARQPGRHPELPRLHHAVTTVEGTNAGDPGRPDRQPGGDQGARHQRRRVRSTPTRPTRSRTRTGSPTCSRSCDPARIPFAFTYTYGRWSATRSRAGWCSPRCSSCGLAAVADSRWRSRPTATRSSTQVGRNQTVTADQSGGNIEGQGDPLRAGRLGLFAASTTGTSTGADQLAARQLHAPRRRRCRWSTSCSAR